MNLIELALSIHALSEHALRANSPEEAQIYMSIVKQLKDEHRHLIPRDPQRIGRRKTDVI